METQKKETLCIAGLAVQTSNAQGFAEKDIPALWQKFMSQNIGEELPEKTSTDIYCVYCQYEGDHTQPYTTLIGYAVQQNSPIPPHLKSVTIEPGNYAVFKAQGDLTGTAVIDTWKLIWNTPLERNYKADFEVYGPEAANPKNGKIDIFVGIH